MDYDRNDALLHWLFRQTQGDAWFRPEEEGISSGVALRVTDAATAAPDFRLFPYETPSLLPFHDAVEALNPVVAVKVRSAAVHAALGEVSSEDTHIYIDSETRIQILETMLLLPHADREQSAAFIRDERVLVVWSESIDRIVPLCADFEERLIKLLWRSRPLLANAPSDRTHLSGGVYSAGGGTPLLSSPAQPFFSPPPAFPHSASGPFPQSNSFGSATTGGPDANEWGIGEVPRTAAGRLPPLNAITNPSLGFPQGIHNSGGSGPSSRSGSLFRVHGGVVRGVFGELGREPAEYEDDPPASASPASKSKKNRKSKSKAKFPKGKNLEAGQPQAMKRVEKRTWYGRRYTVFVPDEHSAEKAVLRQNTESKVDLTQGQGEEFELSPQASPPASNANTRQGGGAARGQRDAWADPEKGLPSESAAAAGVVSGYDSAGKRLLYPATPRSTSASTLHERDPERHARWGIGGHIRPVNLYAPIYNGLAAGLALVFVGNGVKILLVEWKLEKGEWGRWGLVSVIPMLYCVSLFFAMQIIQNIAMCIGPIAHFHTNSKYYSAVKPGPNKEVDENLPHVTIQMPVYRENLDTVLAPSIASLKKAMQTYARQGGTSTIFVCDDGLRLLSPSERDARLAFYATHNIGWVARPRHDADDPEGFKRAGRFKKASNMNYGLALSLKLEKHLENLIANVGQTSRDSTTLTRSDLHGSSNLHDTSAGTTQFGTQYQNHDGDESVRWGTGGGPGSPLAQGVGAAGAAGGTTPVSLSAPGTPTSNLPPPSPFVNGNNNNNSHNGGTGRSTPNSGIASAIGGGNANGNGTTGAGGHAPHATLGLTHWGDHDLEEKALGMAIEDVWEESGRRFRPWAANGRACRMGEIILIVDSDTVVPEDCLRDAAREMKESPTVGVIQHESDVLQVAHHYFENGIAYFTRRINKCISIACANGEVAAFMGHNAFLRWKALQDAAFTDPADGKVKIWSETNVSEDFDMALRLMLKGYIIRWATYSNGGFKEGVSLSVDDELNRWQKYAYGCNELLFNPIAEWWRKGPIAKQIHTFLWSSAPLHYKISMMAYMFSYYGIAGGITIALVNYVLLGLQLPVDGYFMHSFEIWLATTVVFWGSGTVGYTLLEYRLGRKSLLAALFENLIWIPFFFFFFGGLSIPLTQAVFAHLFSYNMQWAATKKEVERSNFFKEIPKIVKRFWFPLLLSSVLLIAIVILATPLVPLAWRIPGEAWAVILPLAMTCTCHILFPIVLNPWLMVFSY